MDFTMTTYGLSYGFHDAAYSYLEGQDIVEAHHSERHSRIKNDRNLHIQIDGFSVFYEKPFKKNIRRFLYGQSWITRQQHNVYINHH